MLVLSRSKRSEQARAGPGRHLWMAKLYSSVHSRRGQPCGVFCSWAQGKYAHLSQLQPLPGGAVSHWAPHSSGSADGPTLREAADEEFTWADLQRKIIDSSGLVKSISPLYKTIIQRLARLTS